jgi:hypothetical protein
MLAEILPTAPWLFLLCSRRVAEIFYQKYMEICSQRLSTNLPHYHRELTSMVGGVVDDVLHQVHQFDPRSAKGKQFRQVFAGHAIYKLRLLPLPV